MNFNQFLIALLLLVMMTISGCGYPPMSPQAIEMARSLYTVCNQKREAMLSVAEEKIDALKKEGALTDSEVASLQEIIAMARDGKWENAMLASRQIMEDQVPH